MDFWAIFDLDFFKKKLFLQKSKIAEKSTFYLENFNSLKLKMGQKSTFYLENKNSETPFISSTFKVGEIKVVSEF